MVAPEAKHPPLVGHITSALTQFTSASTAPGVFTLHTGYYNLCHVMGYKLNDGQRNKTFGNTALEVQKIVINDVHIYLFKQADHPVAPSGLGR